MHRGLCVQGESTYMGCVSMRGRPFAKKCLPSLREGAQGEHTHDVCVCRASCGLCELVGAGTLGE